MTRHLSNPALLQRALRELRLPEGGTFTVTNGFRRVACDLLVVMGRIEYRGENAAGDATYHAVLPPPTSAGSPTPAGVFQNLGEKVGAA